MHACKNLLLLDRIMHVVRFPAVNACCQVPFCESSMHKRAYDKLEICARHTLWLACTCTCRSAAHATQQPGLHPISSVVSWVPKAGVGEDESPRNNRKGQSLAEAHGSATWWINFEFCVVPVHCLCPAQKTWSCNASAALFYLKNQQLLVT
jgi:hypothetical protein